MYLILDYFNINISGSNKSRGQIGFVLAINFHLALSLLTGSPSRFYGISAIGYRHK